MRTKRLRWQCDGWVDWLTHTVVSSVIHGMIYNLTFRMMNRLTLGEVGVLLKEVRHHVEQPIIGARIGP